MSDGTVDDERSDVRRVVDRQSRERRRAAGGVRRDQGAARAPMSLLFSRRSRAALPKEVRVVTKPELIEFERKFPGRSYPRPGRSSAMGTIVGFVVGMLISYQVTYTDLADQLPQYATLKAMGYGTGYLMRVVFEQAALSALAGLVPAWLLCLLLYYVIGQLALLPLHMTPEPDLVQPRPDPGHVPDLRQRGDPPRDHGRSGRGLLMCASSPNGPALRLAAERAGRAARGPQFLLRRRRSAQPGPVRQPHRNPGRDSSS